MSNILSSLEEEEEVFPSSSMKRVRSWSCEQHNHISKRKKKDVVMDLPRDLAEEVLSRVPMTSLRSVRSTCKTMKGFRPSSCGLSKRRTSYEKKHGVMDLPNDLVLTRSSLKRVRSLSCEEWNGLSKRKKSYEKKDVVMDLPNDLVISSASLKRVRPSSCEQQNDISKRKKSYEKKDVVMDLPNDLAEEVLSRVPLTSLRSVRSTCKTWNAQSRSKSFAKKHLTLERKLNMVVMMADYKLSLMSINLDDKEESCIKPRGKLISVDDHETDVCQVFHDRGLLLCLCLGENRLVVWNPYLGQTRWIDPKPNLHRLSSYVYGFGYDSSTKSHKILRYVNYNLDTEDVVEFNMYDLKSGSNGGSWRVLDFGSIPLWTTMDNHDRGVSLKGNTYWFATDRENREADTFLICFDFTKERFGPRLPLPPSIIWCHPEDTLSLSSVREEQLVVLFQPWDTLRVEIWITTKINPNHVSWSNNFFLQVSMRPLIGDHQFLYSHASFFIDEEKKVAVVFDKDKDDGTRNVAYIVGADGSLKQVDLGESLDQLCYPLVSPYLPTSLLLLT